jgi:hypothetical protein
MPVPAQSTTHVADALALLISRYSKATVVTGIVSALSAEAQALENAVWGVINALLLVNQPLAGGPWDVLDKLAALVGVPGGRLGRTDADLLAAIQIQIRINHSHGLAEDIIQIVALVTTGATYTEFYPASFEVDAFGITASAAKALIRYLSQARSAATAGYLNFSLAVPGSTLILDSTTGHPATAGLLDDAVAGGFPYLMSSLQPI